MKVVSCINGVASQERPAAISSGCATKSLALAVLFNMAALVQAQFSYTTNNGAVTITGYTGAGGAVNIPSKIDGLPVTSIASHAFYGRTSLTAVSIPDSVTNIGDYAFQYCSGLTNVRIGNSVTTIGYVAFASCLSLTSVTIGTSVTSIGNYAFQYCSGLTSVTIPDSVIYLGWWAFQYCSNLTSVTIPGSVTNLGSYAFQSCTSLTAVYFKGNAPTVDLTVFDGVSYASVYYLPGTTGWGSTFGGRPTVLWNPLIQASGPSFGMLSNQFGFTIAGTTNIPIVIEACANLTSASWVSLQGRTLTNGSIYFSDPEWMNYPARFYRIRSP